MSDASLPFGVWREELAAELVEAREALAAAMVDLIEAEAAHDAAAAAHAALRDAIAPIRAPASAIAARVRHSEEALHDMAAAVLRSRGVVTGLREQCADLEEALRQVAELMAPASEVELAGEVSR
jgi:leucyl aminopeptidase (aminopeptidase T)